MSSKIVVETIGYFSLDSNFFIALGDEPSKLNANAVHAICQPLFQRKSDVVAPSAEFVSFLTTIASQLQEKDIVLFRWKNINYACSLAKEKIVEQGTKELENLARGQTFADLLKEKHGSKFYKAVNRVTVTMPDKSEMVLFITAEIDASLPNANNSSGIEHVDLLNTELEIPADYKNEVPENYILSMLYFIRKTPSVIHNNRPPVECVSSRQILTSIATSQHLKKDIVLFRWKNINFACWLAECKLTEPGTKELENLACDQVFADRHKEENGSKLYKAVNRVTVTMPDKSKMVLLISAEIDARLPNDDAFSDIEHVEIKSTLMDQSEWLRSKSRYTYWQALLGNTNKIVLRKLKSESVKDGNEHYIQWNREEGENRITEFLKYQKERLSRNEQAIVMKQEQVNDQVEWTAEDVDPESIEFCRQVKKFFSTDGSEAQA